MDEKKEKFKYLLAESHKDQVLHDEWDWMQFHKDPDGAISDMEKVLYGEHLDRETMEEGLLYIGQDTDTRMPMWTFEAFEILIKRMGIDFKDVAYNEYDVNLTAQDYASVHKSLGSDHQKFITIALERLEINPEYAYQHYLELCEKYST